MLIHNFKDNKLSLLDIGARDGIGWPWNTIKREMLNIILVETDPVKAIIKYIEKESNGFYPFKNGSRILHRVFHVLTHSFKLTYEGWANGDPHIGSKKKSFFWF